jgi:hypothetical protein
MTGVRTVTAYGQSDMMMINHNQGRGAGDRGILANKACEIPFPHIVIIQQQDQHHHLFAMEAYYSHARAQSSLLDHIT